MGAKNGLFESDTTCKRSITDPGAVWASDDKSVFCSNWVIQTIRFINLHVFSNRLTFLVRDKKKENKAAGQVYLQGCQKCFLYILFYPLID